MYKSYLSFGGRSAAEISHVNFTSFGIHHDCDGVAFLFVEPPDALDDASVPVACAMAHVDSRHVHSSDGQRLQLFEPARGGTDRAHELRPPRAPEPVLLQLRLRHGVHLDGPRRVLLTRTAG